MRLMYIDCSAGLSGSALLGALVELGAKPEFLIKKIKSVMTVPFLLTFDKRKTNRTTATATILKVDAGEEAIPAASVVNQLITKVPKGDELGEGLNSFFNRFLLAQAKISGLPAAEVVMKEVEILRMAVIAAGFFTALEQLRIERIIASPLPVGFHLTSRSSAPLILELTRGTAVKQYEKRGRLHNSTGGSAFDLPG